MKEKKKPEDDTTKIEERPSVPLECGVMPTFKVGEYVYYEKGRSIGKISDIIEGENGPSYRINYCQFKDPDRGTCGGNGPIWREGYPQYVTEASDVLFVAAMKEADEIKRLRMDLEQAERNYSALKRARGILEA